MSVEGLHALLEKEAIVATQAADRLKQAPQIVEEAYLNHVRSYIPLGRVAQGDEGMLTVAEYEKRLIRMVRDGKAPTGYITAEYGYGKTSTCLYLWQKCRETNLVAVPPFEFTQLQQLITATHAWVCYELTRTKPDLITRADAIRASYETSSLDELARQNGLSLEKLRELYDRGQLILAISPIRYVQYFEEMTALVIEAGFDGLVLLPDELQQYLDPRIKGGVEDPVVPLFDIVQGMITRQGKLRCGLIFSIPARELSLLNEQRGDFVQRLKAQGLGIDLRNIYNEDFAAQLWDRLANQFGFRDIASSMVHPATLQAIGEIAARPDLASGPRTVVAVFKRIVNRYLSVERPSGYTPIDLIDDYRAGVIPFDETGKIQRVVNARLATGVVTGNADRERLMRLLAAFPTEGCPRPLLDEFGLTVAADDVAAAGLGDLVIFLGSASAPGMTLRGLEPQSEGPSDWLTETLREFSRNYIDTADLTISRAEDAFERLLFDYVFTAPNWKSLYVYDRRLTQNRGLLLEGSFANTMRRFPQRRVLVRVLRQGEAVIDSDIDADLSIDFVLSTHFDVPLSQRSSIAGAIDETDPRHLRVDLNLAHRTAMTLRQDLHLKLQPVVNPYKVCPLLLLALDEYLEEKRRKNQIPQTEDSSVKNMFQSSLIDECFAELWNSELCGPNGAAGMKLTESLFLEACTRIFPDYRTLMSNAQWQTALHNEYCGALRELRSQAERQGESYVEGTKSEISQLLKRSNTAFDSFVSSFPQFIKIEQEFKGSSRGAVLFSLHPLETLIVDALKGSSSRTSLAQSGRKPEVMPSLPMNEVYLLATRRGYRDRETEEVLHIMQSRGLIELIDQQGGLIALAPSRNPNVTELADSIKALQERVAPLAGYFGGELLLNIQQQLDTFGQAVPELRRTLDEKKIGLIDRSLRSCERQLTAVRSEKQDALKAALAGFVLPEHPGRDKLEFLSRQVSLELFGRHLETIRRDLANRYEQQQKECTSIRDDWEGLRGMANTELEVQDLVTLAKKTHSLEDRLKQILSTGQNLDRQFFAFVQASSLLDNLVQLQRRLLNPSLAKCEAELATLLHAINSAFATKRAEALAEVSLWDNQRLQIEQYATETEAALKGEFESWQDDYRGLLTAHLRLDKGEAPQSQTYNSANLKECRERYTADVQRTVRAVLGRISDCCANVSTRLTAIAYSGDLDALPMAEQDEAQNRAEQCQQLLNDIKQEATILLNRADEDVDGIFDNPSPAFASFCQSLGQLQIRAAHMSDLLSKVEHALMDARLSEPEQRLYDAVLALAQERQRIDIGLLLQHSGQPVATVMTLLGALYMKRKLYISVEVTTGLRAGHGS